MPTFTLQQPTLQWGRAVAPAASAFDPRARYHVIPDFTSLAQPMREQLDRHFADPYHHGPERQVWNFWYVPGSYTYLRTDPNRVLGEALVDQFMRELTEFAATRLGMDDVTRPWLSLYVDSFGQAIHNDSRNGSIGYVYSLTRWDERQFSGGETMLFHQQDYWSGGRFTEAGSTRSFYELVPARFNQLLLFDDRVPHSVPTVRGAGDPAGARLVMHGHITARRIMVRGPLEQPQHLQSAAMQQLAQRVRRIIEAHRGRAHGVATFALDVAPDGAVRDARVLIDRVLPLAAQTDAATLVAGTRGELAKLRFDATDGESTVTVPLVIA
jgi:hypothetical protein